MLEDAGGASGAEAALVVGRSINLLYQVRLLDRDVAGVAEQEKVASKRVPTGTPKQDEHIISLGRIIGDRWVHSFFVRDNARYKHTWIM